MANVHIPSAKEIHMIAFLTVRGWMPANIEATRWQKKGRERQLSYDEEQANNRYPRHTVFFATEWELDDAYSDEMSRDETLRE